jgi:arylsulfatase A-like enzyme
MKIIPTLKAFLIVLLSALVMFSCRHDSALMKYNTENVIVVVMDGARYSEVLGDAAALYTPRLKNNLTPTSVISHHFYNNGSTFTIPGHAALTTGNFQEIDNNGGQLPQNSSIFQHWIKANNNNTEKAWIIASKDKLEILKNCVDSEWNEQYMPSTNCGANGLGTGYREDSVTMVRALSILTNNQPKLALINFREPDYSAHTDDWSKYIKGIEDVDEYIYRLWDFIENDPHYKGKTTLFVTNDHGRHLDSVNDGYISHGDDCLGCRHISFYAFGPDFKQGYSMGEEHEMIDIPATIAELLHFDLPDGKGRIMQELFK